MWRENLAGKLAECGLSGWMRRGWVRVGEVVRFLGFATGKGRTNNDDSSRRQRGRESDSQSECDWKGRTIPAHNLIHWAKRAPTRDTKRQRVEWTREKWKSQRALREFAAIQAKLATAAEIECGMKDEAHTELGEKCAQIVIYRIEREIDSIERLKITFSSIYIVYFPQATSASTCK